jgi:hypothetical protein
MIKSLNPSAKLVNAFTCRASWQGGPIACSLAHYQAIKNVRSAKLSASPTARYKPRPGQCLAGCDWLLDKWAGLKAIEPDDPMNIDNQGNADEPPVSEPLQDIGQVDPCDAGVVEPAGEEGEQPQESPAQDFRGPSPAQSSEPEASCDTVRILRNEANSPVVYSDDHREHGGNQEEVDIGPADPCDAHDLLIGPSAPGDIVPGDSTSPALSPDQKASCDAEPILRNEANSPVTQGGEPTEHRANAAGTELAQPFSIDDAAMHPGIVELARKRGLPPNLIPHWIRWRQARLYSPLPRE